MSPSTLHLDSPACEEAREKAREEANGAIGPTAMERSALTLMRPDLTWGHTGHTLPGIRAWVVMDAPPSEQRWAHIRGS